MQSLVFTPEVDDRVARGKVHSRLGVSLDAHAFAPDFNFHTYLKQYLADQKTVNCVLVDEAQFLSAEQVEQLAVVVDFLDIPVLAYGLRTDFQGKLFPGSQKLLAWADELREVKTMCHCGHKATMNLRVDASGEKIEDGPQVLIGGDTMYISVCRKHFQQGESIPFKHPVL